MSIAKDWIDSQRADSFAQLIFARIPNCAVTKITAGDEPYDFLISLLGTSPPHVVAVEVKGQRKAPSKLFPLHLPVSTKRQVERLKLPLLLLVIDIVAEIAHYGWIKPPVIAPIKSAEPFRMPEAVELKKLSEGQLAKLILGIVSTKEFWIHHEKGVFRLFISEHADETFHGTILHYGNIPAAGTRPQTLSFDHKNFHGTSEHVVRDKAIAWIKTDIGPNFSVIPVDALS